MSLKHFITTLCILITHAFCNAQPVNDKCSNAINIPISNDGFSMGVFSGDSVSMDSATRDVGETCDESIKKLGTCDKTVWYSFYIPTTRNVEVILKQSDSVIPQIFAGFTIYEAPDCEMNMGDISSQLIPLGKFGASGNSCLQQGKYYVQVSAKNRTRGKIWVDLNITPAATLNYDHVGSPYYIEAEINKRVSKSINVECASIEKAEYNAIKDSAFSKSVWLTIKLKGGTFGNSVRVSFYQSNIKYRLFKTKPNKDSLLSKEPFYDGNADIHNSLCPAQTKDSFLYLQVLTTNKVYQFNVTLFSKQHVVDDWTSPLTTTVKAVLKNNSYHSFTRYFSCEGDLKLSPCKPLVPDSINSSNPNSTYFYHNAGYGILDCQEDGQFTLNISQATRHDLVFLLYEGDMSKGCNLKLVEKSYRRTAIQACLKKGVYTFILASNLQSFSSYSSEIRFTIHFRKTISFVEHYNISNPENLGIYVFTQSNGVLRSKTLHFHSDDQTVQIDTFKRTGRFIFREVYFMNDSKSEIRNYSSPSTFIFSGRYQSGNLALIPGFNYSTGYIAENQCDFFRRGFYTIVSFYDTAKSGIYSPCTPFRSQITISKEYVCKGPEANTEPGNAMLLNNGKDLATGNLSENILSYPYTLRMCQDCKLNTIKQPVFPCRKNISPTLATNGNRLFYFYTFYIGKNCQIEAPYYSILYKGDARRYPNLCLDSNNVIDPCGQGNVYCNLQGGRFYTLAYLRRSSRTAYIVATPHISSPNDFIANAYDFGDLSLGSQVKAKPMPITCHTFALTNDPSPSSQGFNKNPIPFPDTLNKGRLRKHRNIWYTFTVDGGCNINVHAEKFNTYFAIYKYLGPFDESYENVLAQGLDSTSAKFQRIYAQSSLSPTFTNKGCTKSRYFVAVTPRYSGSVHLEKMYIINVEVTPLNGNHDLGDYCHNAVTQTISQIGNYTLSTDNYCHTYGGSPHENEVDHNLKSTWFKVSIKDLYKSDLEFKYNSTNLRLQKYILYAGTCNALTKVAEVQNQFNYFTLSCMGVGDYYIQAISNDYVSGEMSFSVNAKTPQNQNCKPYDFKQPIAQFEINGGCNSDTLRLKNLSTQGDSIRHFWYVNNTLVSKKLNPVISIKNTDFKVGINKIKLVVKNIGYQGLTDSTVNNYSNDTTHFYAKIVAPEVFSCRDTVTLKVKTNYPHKLNYYWNSGFFWQLNPYAKEQTFMNISQLRVTVQLTSDNCVFRDTADLIANKALGIFKDSSLCEGQGEIKYDLRQMSWLYLNEKLVNDSFLTLNKSGTYHLYYNTDGCLYRDTIKLHFANKRDTLFESESVAMCNYEAFKYTFAKNLNTYNWSNGGTERTVEINKTGPLHLFGDIDGCRKQDFTLNVRNDSVPISFLRDTSICQNEPFQFKSNYPGFIIEQTHPSSSPFVVNKKTQIIMSLRKNDCVKTDTAQITMIPAPTLFVDSATCFTIGNDYVKLDAQEAQSYHWVAQNNKTQYLKARSYDRFTVQRLNLMSCKDSIVFNVIENCPVRIFIPNAFSPNSNLRNDAFKPIITGVYDSYNMSIFNRWGQIVYESKQGSWDGMYKGRPAPDGVYAVLIQVRAKGKMLTYRSTLTLVR